MSQIKDICKKYDKDPKDKLVTDLREILENHMGYFPQFAKWIFKGGTTIEETKNIIDLLKVIKISKPIGSFKTSEELYDHIHELQNKRKLNQVIKSIPSKSRRNVSKRIKEAIFNNIEKEEEFKDFFSKKGGTCKTEDDLYQRTMEIVNIGGNYSYKSVLNKIKKRLFFLKFSNIIVNFYLGVVGGFSSPSNWFKKSNWIRKNNGGIVYNDGKTIIVKVKSFKLSALIGSRHWCISRNPTYWNSYMRDNRTQYFIYQTEYDRSSKKSMVGVTVHPIAGRVHAAHYKNDSVCPTIDIKKYSTYLKGKNIPIDNMNDLIKYDIYDINILDTIPDWKLSMINTNINTLQRNFRKYDTHLALNTDENLNHLSYDIYFNKLSKSIFSEIESNITTFQWLLNSDIDSSIHQDIYKKEYFIHCLQNLEITDSRLYSLTFHVNEDKAFDYYINKYGEEKTNFLMEKLIFSKFIIHFKRSRRKLISTENSYYDGVSISDGNLMLNDKIYPMENIKEMVNDLFLSNPENVDIEKNIEIIYLPMIKIIDSLEFKLGNGKDLNFLHKWKNTGEGIKIHLVETLYNQYIENELNSMKFYE